MDAMLRIGLLTLASVALGGCAVGAKLGWTADHVVPSDIIQNHCDAAVRTLQGKPDHNIAMRACVQAKTRQGVD